MLPTAAEQPLTQKDAHHMMRAKIIGVLAGQNENHPYSHHLMNAFVQRQ